MEQEKNPTPEEDMEIFEQAVEEGDLTHALFHLSCAFSVDPMDAQALRRLEDLCAQYDDLLPYLALEENNYFAPVALRAHLLARRGESEEAMNLMWQVIRAAPQVPYLHWVKQWFEDDCFLASLQEHSLCLFIARCMNEIDAFSSQPLYHLLIDALRAIPEGEDDTARNDVTDRYVMMSMLLRRVGDLDSALAMALRGVEKHGTANNATFAALCYKEMEDEEHAETYFNLGVQLDPENVAGYNDMADFLFDRKKYEKAADYYRRVLKVWPEDDWAQPSLLFCEYMLSGRRDKKPLQKYADKHLENDRAARLLAFQKRLERDPYVDFLADSGEAALGIERQFAEREIREAKMSITCLEAPSALNALRLAMSSYGQHEAKLTLICSKIPSPSPLEPQEPDGVVLWQYDGDYTPMPDVKRCPDKHVSELVAGIAKEPYQMQVWYAMAERLAPSLTAENIADLYGCMVYPPRPQGGFLASQWLMRVQFAAVMLLAQLGGTMNEASEWRRSHPGKLRSPELVRICFGQLDWPVIPALTVLVHQVNTGESDPKPVEGVMARLLARVYKDSHCFFEYALVCALARIPGQPPAFYEQMRTRRLNLEEV